ncbi:MAG: hypothetical protein MZU97_21000 [Bacillus subtilis]|nr:hypothetical protein [Bacillus subtilis]
MQPRADAVTGILESEHGVTETERTYSPIALDTSPRDGCRAPALLQIRRMMTLFGRTSIRCRWLLRHISPTAYVRALSP